MEHLLLFIKLQSWIYSILSIGYAATIVSCIVIILSENRNPIKSLAWITVLIFLPIAGLAFYVFFGRNPKTHHTLLKHQKRRLLHNFNSRPVSLKDVDPSVVNKQIVKLTDTIGGTPLTIGNEIEVFTSGERKFETLKRDLRRATNFICLQYYIFTDDHIGHEIADILIERAHAGVNVKVIYDHVGSFSVKNEFYKRMRRAGIDAQPFLRVTFPQLASRLNWRNHRKIVVIDGKVGYIGGMNIADRYVEEINGKAPWRDTHFRVRGAIINSLLYSFASDWSYMGRPLPTDERRFKPELVDNNVGIQLITSGPDSRWANIALAYQKAISGAKKSIFIQTPYFLPTDDLLKSLQAAALAQVDVRIMIPRHSDSYLLNWASFSYVAQCLQAGIKIYLYEERMIHSKMMVIDDAMVTAGSTNFDFRSFEHNFESNIFVYDRNFNTRMRDIFFKDLNQCTKLTYTRWRHRPFLQKVMESVVRLLSPIL